MNLILLLSALLSALSGTAGVRAAQVPMALTANVASVVKATAQAVAQVAARPVQALAGPVLAILAEPRALALPAAVPAFASRRRE